MDDELRYAGKSPSNYVEFNGETDTWRMIGLVNVKTTKGIEQRVKIIRDSIGDYVWDTSENSVNDYAGVNEWSQADIMKLLNPGYETNKLQDRSGNEQDSFANNSLYWNGSSGICYINYNNSTKNCDFTDQGLSGSESYISDDIIWNTGTNGNNDYETGLPKHFYDWERSTNDGKMCNPLGTYGKECNDEVTRTTEWQTEGDKKALVGLMYPSDYGYATSGGAETNRTSCLDTEMYNWDGDGNEDCYNNDWLFIKNGQWTMSPATNSLYANYVFMLWWQGRGNATNAGNHYNIRPVVYLKPSVMVSDGDGSYGNNYKLEL